MYRGKQSVRREGRFLFTLDLFTDRRTAVLQVYFVLRVIILPLSVVTGANVFFLSVHCNKTLELPGEYFIKFDALKLILNLQ